MKQILLSGWNFMRWLRLIMGVYLLVNAWLSKDWMAGFFGAFFTFQAVTNTGCCGASGCAVPAPSGKRNTTQEVEFEEVK